MQGTSYAIPTKDRNLHPLPLGTIEKHVLTFKGFAVRNPFFTFKVTRIGCGLAGYTDVQIAPMFRDAPINCELPEGWRASQENTHGS